MFAMREIFVKKVGLELCFKHPDLDDDDDDGDVKRTGLLHV